MIIYFATDVPRRWGNCGHSMYFKCYNSGDKQLKVAVHKLEPTVISSIVKDLTAGMKMFFDLTEAELHPGLEYSITKYCQMMLMMKQWIRQDRMNVMTKSLEFVRILYGVPGSKTVIVVLHVCQACGRAPKYDYDYFVVPGKGDSPIVVRCMISSQ